MSDAPEQESVSTQATPTPRPSQRWEPFRFIHASDFQLHSPIAGLAVIPEAMKEGLASAAYIAAERVFDAAINERVAFVLLSGNLVDLDYGGPRAIAFLLAQFERLAKREIQVFWCGGETDLLERWPTSIELPPNVRLFSSTLVDSVSVKGPSGKTMATIIGAAHDPHRSNLRDFQSLSAEGFPIGLTCGRFDPAKLAAHGVRYWAMGGKETRSQTAQGPVTFAWPGTPQGRSRDNQGPHGALLVSVEREGGVRTQSIDVEVARWMNIAVSVSESVKLDALKDLLADRALQITSKLPDANLLVHWHIATTGDYTTTFRKQENRQTLIQWLRHEFGGSPGLWTVDLTISPSQTIPGVWFEEDTILGDFLREISRFRTNEDLPLQLANYDPGTEEHETVGRLSKVDSKRRDILLDEVILEGIERLGGNEA